MEKKKAYVVATAHLDTVWRWSLAKTINEYIPDTLTKNFDLLEKYPNYKFNFEGAYRYELIKEFYPKAFEIIKDYVNQGRWCATGAAYENGDVNIPSPEAITRNLLLGYRFFKTELNTQSKNIFLPDCFGFGWALPSIAANAKLLGFSTQKLSWGSAYGIPFDIGRWKGPDGKEIFTNINARSYRYKFTGDIRADLSIINRISDNAQKSSLPWANHLYGTGDWGGAPTELSVKAVEASVRRNSKNEDFEVISAAGDDIFKDLDRLSKAKKEALPVWENELLMTSHGAGGYTSRTMSKRLNSQCEVLAAIAEQACTYAYSLGFARYPSENINQSWKRISAHQFHDDITGTSTMEVYNETWGDYFYSLLQLKSEYYSAAKRITRALDTSWVDKKSVAVIVNNPTQFFRNDVIEVKLRSTVNCNAVRVFDKNGKEMPSQLIRKSGKELKIAFQTDVKGFGYKVYEVRPSDEAYKTDCGVIAENHIIENEKYKLIFNKNGDIAYLFDKELNRSVIDSPIKMALFHNTGALSYPSWELRKEDIDKEPYCYANTPKFTVLEKGPVRARIKVEREAEYSTITQIVTLSKDSKYVDVKCFVDWKTRRTLLKAVFPVSAKNENATYDLGLGVISRGNNTDKLYEVPAQKWADITDKSGEFGVSILSDCKYGWDKPNDNTLRLTCIHTPAGAFTKDARQDLQDLGRNIFSFAIYSHEGGFETGTQKQAEIFTKQMPALQTDYRAKDTELTDDEAFITISNDNAIIKAVKKCEYDGDIVIRVYESEGKTQRNVTLGLAIPIKKASITDTLETFIKPLKVLPGGKVKFNLKPYEVKTIKLRLESANLGKLKKVNYVPMRIEYNAKGFTEDDNMRNVILQGAGFSLPYELLPNRRFINGILFSFFQNEHASNNDVVICRGQDIKIPPNSTRLYFIAGSTLGDEKIKITLENKRSVEFNIKAISKPISRWDMAGLGQVASVCDSNERAGIEFTHTHHPEGNLPQKAIFNMYCLNVNGCSKITLGENNKVVILAMTATSEPDKCSLITKFEDTVKKDYSFDADIPPIDKIIDKADFVTIRAGKIQDQQHNGRGKGFKRDNIITNIIRSYTKSEW